MANRVNPRQTAAEFHASVLKQGAARLKECLGESACYQVWFDGMFGWRPSGPPFTTLEAAERWATEQGRKAWNLWAVVESRPILRKCRNTLRDKR